MAHLVNLNPTNEVAAPRTSEPPVEYAARLAEDYAALSSTGRRRDLGQFFTPVAVAQFMALLTQGSCQVNRILDPGSGTGVLACAVCETLPGRTQKAHLDAFEVDPTLADLSERSLRNAEVWLGEREVEFSFSVNRSDFVLECSGSLAPGLFRTAKDQSYDLIISNPPYFKLRKTDSRSVAAAEVIHGQPNIYGIFMAISASLLAENGVMVTITPRSFAAGAYFSRCRQHVFSHVVPEAVHLFHSRKAAFKNDAVLQENVILRARKIKPRSTSRVRVSTSNGPEDIDRRNSRTVKLNSVVEISSPKAIFHIPAETTDDAIVKFVREWPKTLHELGLEVSTGPVVAFRARRHLENSAIDQERCAPLLWLQNVRRMAIEWPLTKRGKPQHIRDSVESKGILIQNKTYVVLRRFTAKEEIHRLTAAPLLKGTLPGSLIGLENHLNYIHRPHGQIEEFEAFGLAALLGSRLLDRYFRVSNGNTQVNAAELRCLPLPAYSTLMSLGRQVHKMLGLPMDMDALTNDILGVPEKLCRLLKAG